MVGEKMQIFCCPHELAHYITDWKIDPHELVEK
jgi:hypothetical protein